MPEEHDPLPPSHPNEWQWESACIIQRNAVVDDTKASLQFTITAMAADAACEVSAANASRALRGIQGIKAASRASRRHPSPSRRSNPSTSSFSADHRRPRT